jgi:hypothetical protein
MTGGKVKGSRGGELFSAEERQWMRKWCVHNILRDVTLHAVTEIITINLQDGDWKLEKKVDDNISLFYR